MCKAKKIHIFCALTVDKCQFVYYDILAKIKIVPNSTNFAS